MEESNLSIGTSMINQQPLKKPNYWKPGFVIVLLMLVLSIGLIAFYINSNARLASQLAKSIISNKIAITPSIVPLAVPQQDAVQIISPQIRLYRSDIEGGQIIATFQIKNLNKASNINKVTYWTDKNSPSEAKTQPFSEFINIPVSEINDYVFFQFENDKNNSSEIYASQLRPMVPGKLAE
jgi:hypothetical protein